MALEKNTMAARYDDENVQFVEWLAKQADNGYGVKRSQVLNRGWSFIRALYSVSEDAVSFNCLQRLLCSSGLPMRGGNGPGLASDTQKDEKQIRLNFFSRRKAAVATVVEAYKAPFFNRLGPFYFITRRAA